MWEEFTQRPQVPFEQIIVSRNKGARNIPLVPNKTKIK